MTMRTLLRRERRPFGMLLLVAVLLFSEPPTHLWGQGEPYSIALLNLDPDAVGPLFAEARFENGARTYTSQVKYGELSEMSIMAHSDQPPTETYIMDTARNKRVTGLYINPHFTYIVTYGPGPGSTFTLSASSMGEGVVSTHTASLAATFHGMNSGTGTMSILPRTHTRFSDAVEDARIGDYGTLSLKDGTWWVLMGIRLTRLFVSRADDTLAIGQAGYLKTPTAWALKVDPIRDSGRIRVVNATSTDQLRLLVDGVDRSSCGALATSASVVATTGIRRIQIVDGGTTLLDTTLVLYPHLSIDITIADDGNGGITSIVSERLINSIGKRITNGPIKRDGKYLYWASTYRIVAMPTGSLRNGRIEVRDTALAVADRLLLASTPAQREPFAQQHHHRALDVVDGSGRLLQRYPLDPERFDSTVYLFVENDGAIAPYTYRPFDETPQQLRPMGQGQSPDDVPYHLRIASFVRRHEGIELHVAGSDNAPAVPSGWLSDTVGGYVGRDLPFSVVATGGGQLGSGTLPGSPGGTTMLLVDDDPSGGVRTISYAMNPLSTSRTIRLVNFTEGIGPLTVTYLDRTDSIVIPPVPEGSATEPIGVGTNSFVGIVRNASGDSLFILTTSSHTSREATAVVDGSAEQKELRLHVIESTVKVGADSLRPSRITALLSGVTTPGEPSHQFRLFPNPTSGALRIEMRDPMFRDGAIELIDRLGRIVWSGAVQSGVRGLEIDLSSIAPGTYRCELRDDTEAVVISRTVIVVR